MVWAGGASHCLEHHSSKVDVDDNILLQVKLKEFSFKLIVPAET